MNKITFCGGGSAGHVMPNMAICEEIAKKYDISYLGTCGIEKRICKDFGVKFYEFDGVKLVRGKFVCNLSIPFKLVKSIRQCKEILQEIKPDLLFCKGGYASLPPAFAAAKLKVPVLTHESDLTAGLANKIIAGKSEKVLTTFPATAREFKNGLHVGSPMRRNLFGRDRTAAKMRLGLDSRQTVIVFGGGSGSRAINESLREIVPELCKNYNVLHLCGRGNAVSLNVYGYRQIEFCDDMGEAYACADYAVARCGSNSAHELLALKIPTLFIPLDNGSSRGDQIKNAEYFKNLNLCAVLEESNLSGENLKKAIEALIADKGIKNALRTSDTECANAKIIGEIEKIINR